MRANEVLNKYYEVVNNHKAEMDKIKNEKVYGEQWKLEKMKETQKKLMADQEKFKQEYELKIKNELQEIQEKMLEPIPEILNAGIDFTKGELQLLAQKHNDNYFAIRKIQDMAAEKNIFIDFEYRNYMKDLKELQKAQETIDSRFSADPLADTPEARLRASMGL